MVGYAKEEIIPITRIVRNLGGILNQLKTRKLKKVAISRNNTLESVIIPVEEYEKLREAYDLMEHIDIYKLVKEREDTGIKEFIPLEQVLEENGLL
ncbi:MAG: hypothetical protein KAW12_02180 [Candidatus Aminicenantes bacterium]|nr:hypothetical protein [Candidatus Aminicenantes bacterium]